MAKKVDYVFQRIETKYLLTKTKQEEFLNEIEPYMQLDEYGLHTICNIYYDTPQYELIRRSIEKTKYKEKLRLRSYGVPDNSQEVYIEIKKKYQKVVYKRREGVTMREADAYLNHGIKPSKDSQILHEIDYFMQHYKPEGKLFLAYDRMAYFGREDSSIRITFDRNIRSREYDLDLRKGDYGELLFENGEQIMEIKVGQAMPIWLADSLAKLEIYPVSFSKYGRIYKQLRSETGNRRSEEGEENKANIRESFGGIKICSQA